MRFKRKVQAAEYWTTSRVLCDRCKKPIERTRFDRTEVRIKADIGEVFPECDSRDSMSTDCCLDCWNTAVVPALLALGFTFEEYPTESGPDLTKMIEDPELKNR